MSYFLFILLGYLQGSILFSYYLPLWWKKIDITEDTPDGNPGAFNCIARAGKPLGLIALACDLLKGLLPVLWAANVLDIKQLGFALVIAAPVAGHAFSLFRGFRGGKGITVIFGVMLGLLPIWQPVALLAATYLFFSFIVRITPNRCRSIVTFVCFSLEVMVLVRGSVIPLGCVLAAGIVIYRHWAANDREEKPVARFMLIRRGR